MDIITLLKAARLRTLPLSVAGIITGSALAFREDPYAFRWEIFGWALLTTILFQVLSNFANDYGDGVKGTDNEHRIGPTRALQSGRVTRRQMKRVVLITALLSLLSATVLIYTAFGRKFVIYLGVFCFRSAVCGSGYQIHCGAIGLWISGLGRPICVCVLWVSERGRQLFLIHRELE